MRFRAYHKVRKELYTHTTLLDLIKGNKDKNYDPFADKYLSIDMGTEFKDNGGNFIYENDILQTDKSKLLHMLYLYKDGKCFAFIQNKFNDRKKKNVILPQEAINLVQLQKEQGLKIVGNIHVNKDLLE